MYAPHATDALAEADRLMTICNACRYCEGLCAVFPAMELRRDFRDGDLDYLANLCHACGACLSACQFAPPHEFAVDVPATLAAVRQESYRRNAWPRALGGVFERNGLAISVVAALSVAGFVIAFVAAHEPSVLFAASADSGAFYRLMPHAAMALLFGVVAIYAVVALAIGWRSFQRAGRGRGASGASFAAALHDAGSLRYLDGGGAGCPNDDEAKPRDGRRIAHHLTFYGFLLCFASTCVATVYHYGLGREAPYGWYDLPVVFGVLGGIGIVIGTVGLLRARFVPAPVAGVKRFGMETAFTAMLFLTAATGLLLLAVRTTPAMGLTLALHLGVVFALFLTVPYGKFVHGIYRFAALLQFAAERRAASTSRNDG
ncbi:MAG TPA: tricarballylate utilization 4Fe-4S protein TcuB [Bauldia sp.]|nr:tricarballylate utilization 4Fe-4S protein TcuB [Bauldia sp.]